MAQATFSLTKAFPTLRGDGLRGAVVYSDGQHNDARTNVLLATSAIRRGAVCVNYAEVVDLLREQGRIVGAKVRDRETGEEFQVRAKGVVNACGPYADRVRQLGGEQTSLMVPSAGAHVVLPKSLAPGKYGLLDAHTSDGRVLFLLPWENHVIAGTTEANVPITDTPAAAEEEIAWVLEELRRHLRPDVRITRDDVLAAWSGFRYVHKEVRSLTLAARSCAILAPSGRAAQRSCARISLSTRQTGCSPLLGANGRHIASA